MSLSFEQLFDIRLNSGIPATEILYENMDLKIEYGNIDGFLYVTYKGRTFYKHIKDIAYEIVDAFDE